MADKRPPSARAIPERGRVPMNSRNTWWLIAAVVIVLVAIYGFGQRWQGAPANVDPAPHSLTP
jgi:hypothetical protein